MDFCPSRDEKFGKRFSFWNAARSAFCSARPARPFFPRTASTVLGDFFSALVSASVSRRNCPVAVSEVIPTSESERVNGRSSLKESAS